MKIKGCGREPSLQGVAHAPIKRWALLLLGPGAILGYATTDKLLTLMCIVQLDQISFNQLNTHWMHYSTLTPMGNLQASHSTSGACYEIGWFADCAWSNWLTLVPQLYLEQHLRLLHLALFAFVCLLHKGACMTAVNACIINALMLEILISLNPVLLYLMSSFERIVLWTSNGNVPVFILHSCNPCYMWMTAQVIHCVTAQ